MVGSSGAKFFTVCSCWALFLKITVRQKEEINITNQLPRRYNVLLLLDIVLSEHLDDHANLRVLVDSEGVSLLMNTLQRLQDRSMTAAIKLAYITLDLVVLSLRLAFLGTIEDLLCGMRKEKRDEMLHIRSTSRI